MASRLGVLLQVVCCSTWVQHSSKQEKWSRSSLASFGNRNFVQGCHEGMTREDDQEEHGHLLYAEHGPVNESTDG